MGFFGGDGAWLFPLSYLAHIVEEMLMGDRFYFWTRAITARSMSRRAYLNLNVFLLVGMVAATLLIRSRHALWLVPAMGMSVFFNGFGHLAGAVLRRTYSPGLVSAVLIWIPLGLAALVGSTIWLTPGAWWGGVGAGAVLSLLVFGLGLGSSRPLGAGE